MKLVTCIAPVNIAVIKYWGKRDEELILPLNDSISASLDTDVMCAKTTVLASPLLKENKFWLNGEEQDLNQPRLSRCLKFIKLRADRELPHLNWNISICSKNNFPTAAGLASSAAGYACLVYTLAKLYNVDGEISDIARQGSGSACRSIYGGWVQWHKGETLSGEDSIAKQIAPANHWPEMRVLILVTNDSRKKVGSTVAMRNSVNTSSLMKYRVNNVVPQRVKSITEAILKKDFASFAELTMKDSNQMHAVTLDTFPPCVYLSDVSHAIINLVHLFNAYKNEQKVAYTVDAGSNVCIYLLESELGEFVSAVNYIFPKSQNIEQVNYYRGLPVPTEQIKQELQDYLGCTSHKQGELKYIIHTKVGEGPQVLIDPKEHLLLDNGLPK